MRRLFQLCAVALMFVLWAPVAQAQDKVEARYPKREIGMWTVYGFRDKCWMITTGRVNGSIVSFSTVRKNKSFYVSMENRGWTDLVHLKQYPVRVQIGDLDTKATGFAYMTDDSMGPMMGLFLMDDSVDYVGLLRGANRVRLSRDGNVVADFSLADSGEAIAYFAECDEALRAGRFTES
jgi:hypothetical protein